MPRSISSKLRAFSLILFCFIALQASAVSSLAEEVKAKPLEVLPVDDFALKRNFENKLGALLETNKTTSPEILRQQLGESNRKAAISPVRNPAERTEELSTSQLYQRVRQSTLLLGNIYKCKKCSKWHGAMAGGVVIDSGKRLAATNYHVMTSKDASAFGAMSQSGSVFPIIEVMAASKLSDVAIVRLGGQNKLPPALALSSVPAPIGETIHIVSHPDGRFFSYSRGIVSRYFLAHRSRAEKMQVTANFARGSSGSGVADSQGRIVGLVSSTNSIYYKEENGVKTNLQMVIKTCVPVEEIRALLKPATP